MRRHRLLLAPVVIAAVLGAWGMLALAPEPRPVPELALVEIRSWIVAGRGRHMYARITAPEGHEELSTIVEYTGAFMREGYVPPRDAALRDRIVMVERGERVYPFLDIPMDNRLEAVHWVTLDQARELQRDRAFERRYFLLGPNSSSGLRAALESAGIPLPSAMRTFGVGGPLGEFPGIGMSPGNELAPDRWRAHGFTRGPEPTPGDSREDAQGANGD
jgi:hypothetical protein